MSSVLLSSFYTEVETQGGSESYPIKKGEQANPGRLTPSSNLYLLNHLFPKAKKEEHQENQLQKT